MLQVRWNTYTCNHANNVRAHFLPSNILNKIKVVPREVIKHEWNYIDILYKHTGHNNATIMHKHRKVNEQIPILI